MDHCVMHSKSAHPTEETETCKCSVFNNKFDWALTHKSSPNLEPQGADPDAWESFTKWNSCAIPRLSEASLGALRSTQAVREASFSE